MNRTTIRIVIVCMFASLALPACVVGSTIKPQDAHEAEQLADMERLGVAAKIVLGSDWQSSAGIVHSLEGWNGRVNGESITFTNDQLQVNSSPATFRITRTNWDTVSRGDSEDLKSDVVFSANNRGYWYCCPGTFGTAYPGKWEETLRSLRKAFGLPEANDGIVCFLENAKDIFPVGTPVDLGLRLVRLPGAKIDIVNECLDPAQHLDIADSSGNRLPLQRVREHSHTKQRFSGDHSTSVKSLEQDYALNRPGIYQIRLQLPLDRWSHDVVESQTIDIRIVRPEFMTLRLRRLSDEPFTHDSAQPVELEVRMKDGNIAQFSELKIAYNASISKHQACPDIYGSPGRHMAEDITGQLQSIGNGCYRMRFDLSAGYWNHSYSSRGPCESIWALTKPGEKYWISVSISGKMDGKRFLISSNELALE